MVSAANQGYVLGLFNKSNTNSFGIITINPSILATPVAGTGLSASSAAAKTVIAPTAPWKPPESAADISQNVRSALAGQSILSRSNTKLSAPDPTGDYGKLFALYQGLLSLEDLASTASKNKDPLQATQFDKAFQNGLSQISGFVSSASFK